MSSPDTPSPGARRLTVGYSHPESHNSESNLPPKPVPHVRLCGLWLNDAGFAIGRHIKVEVSEGRLTIMPAD